MIPLLSMQEKSEQPPLFAQELQKFRRRMHEKNSFKIKIRRTMSQQRTGSRLNSMKRKRSKKRSKKAERIFIHKANLNPVRLSPLELPIEATLTAQMLRMLIQNDSLQQALSEKKSPEEVCVLLECAMNESDFTGTRKTPFRVPHSYSYLSRILMRARFLGLLLQERESLRMLLLASQLTQEEQAEIMSAFQAIDSRTIPRINKEIWNQKVLELAVDCDGKSLLEKAYESGDEQIINSVKSIQKIFFNPVRLID